MSGSFRANQGVDLPCCQSKIAQGKAIGIMQSRRFSGLPLIGVFAIIYFVAGKIGLHLASLHASASPVWPRQGSRWLQCSCSGIERGRRFLSVRS